MSFMLEYSVTDVRSKSPVSRNRKNGLVPLLKFSVVLLLLLALFCTAPASASLQEGEPFAETERFSSLENAEEGWENRFSRDSQMNVLSTFTIRETKVRSKKDDLTLREYHSAADAEGEVFFAESPVVTGLHLSEDIAGPVDLYPESLSSGPKCREVYSVFTLSAKNYQQGTEAVIRYTLPLAEITDRGSDPSEVSLYFSENGVWRKLPTEYYMDDTAAFFESVTTSLGIFAVVSEECSTDSAAGPVGFKNPRAGPVTLSVAPADFLTHPVSYTAFAG